MITFPSHNQGLPMTYRKNISASYDRNERGGYLRDDTDTRNVRVEIKTKKKDDNRGPGNETNSPRSAESMHGERRPSGETTKKASPAFGAGQLFWALFIDKKEYMTPLWMIGLAIIFGWKWMYGLAFAVGIFKVLTVMSLVTFIQNARAAVATVVGKKDGPGKQFEVTYEYYTVTGPVKAVFNSADSRAHDQPTKTILYAPESPARVLCVQVLPQAVQDYVFATKTISD
jgi:hypothetical protein